ncbi:hypothetical protein AWZ03_015480, partial [Drosophila navojoa]
MHPGEKNLPTGSR